MPAQVLYLVNRAHLTLVNRACRLMRQLKSAKLARWQVQLVSWSGAVLWLSGAAWLVAHYFLRGEGGFGPEANPLEPWMLRVHGAAVIAALLGTASLLVVHVWRGGVSHQRALGVALLSLVAVLTASGCLLYYLTDDALRAWAGLIHWAIGLATLAVFLLHFRSFRRRWETNLSGRRRIVHIPRGQNQPAHHAMLKSAPNRAGHTQPHHGQISFAT